MIEYSILKIPNFHNPHIILIDIIYNCPVCDYEIEIDMSLSNEGSINCEVCDHLIKFEIKKICKSLKNKSFKIS